MTFPLSENDSMQETGVHKLLQILVKKYRQDGVAELFGVRQGTVCKWIKGALPFPEEKLPNIVEEVAKLLDASGSLEKMMGSNEPEGAWLAQSHQRAPDEKMGLARHAYRFFVRYGRALQIGSGTTFDPLMDEILRNQGAAEQALDLIILTTNMNVYNKGREIQKLHSSLRDMQIVLTGGTFLSSLQSLVGPYAEEGVRTSHCTPDCVFMGAAGMSFEKRNIALHYQFGEEIGVQVAYATRVTDQRVILCDHTKLGKNTRWTSQGITIETMLADASECIIVSTWPQPRDHTKYVPLIERQIDHFNELLVQLREKESMKDKQLILRFVDKNGEISKSGVESREYRLRNLP